MEDYRTGYVDDRWSILILLTGAVYRGIHHSFYEGFLSFLLAALVYGAVFFVVPEGIGTGDIFLSAAIAFWLEPAGVFFFIWSSCRRREMNRLCTPMNHGGLFFIVSPRLREEPYTVQERAGMKFLPAVFCRRI